MLTCAASKGELGTRARPPESDSELPRGLGKLCPLNAFAAKGLSSTLCPSLQVRERLRGRFIQSSLAALSFGNQLCSSVAAGKTWEKIYSNLLT